MPPNTPPTIGATQNNHNWLKAQPPTNNAGPVLLAGFTDVFVTGMLIRWIRVSAKPIASPANPIGASLSVAPIMINMNINVKTISISKAAVIEYPSGECSPYPLEANPLSSVKLALPLAIR